MLQLGEDESLTRGKTVSLPPSPTLECAPLSIIVNSCESVLQMGVESHPVSF